LTFKLISITLLPRSSNNGVVLTLLQCAPEGLLIDGDFGGRTEAGVKKLQQRMNRRLKPKEKLEVDGKFGPATRAAVLRFYNLDVNSLPTEIFQGQTVPVESGGGGAGEQ